MEWLEVFSNLGSTGVMAMLCYYMITKSQPQMLASFREEMAEERKQMTENLEAIRLEAKAERTTFQTAIQNLSERFESSLEKQRTDFKDELAEQRATISNLADKVEQIRDAA